jgi:hypothetical protein
MFRAGIRSAFLATSLAFMVCGVAGAAGSGDLGVAVGEPAPRFTLADQSGAERSFDTLLTRGRLAIVFYRSADW